MGEGRERQARERLQELPRRPDLFNEGDLIRHKKFGDGIVTRILDQKKVEIMFKDESRTLAQGLTD